MRARRVMIWSAAALLLALAVATAAALGTAWWALRSERGSAWLLSHVPNIEVQGPRGALLGNFDAARVVVHLAGTGRVTIAGLAWRGIAVERGTGPLWLRIDLASLTITRVDVALASSTGGAPAKTPTDLRLPIEFELRALRIGELHLAALGDHPLRALSAHVHLGLNDGAEHRVEALSLGWDRLQAQGSATIESAGPMKLKASLGLASEATTTLPAWVASATLVGPLAEPLLDAKLSSTPGTAARTSTAAPTPPQALDLHAALRPFAAWPLGELRASTQALDLSAFVSTAPTTALTGHATATTSAANAPAHLTLDLRNALPGRWNDGKLPLHHLAADLIGRPDQPDAAMLQKFTLELGSPQIGAGQITGSGQWSPGDWTLAATLADVQPALLDARAPAMRLSGPLSLDNAVKSTGTGASVGSGTVAVAVAIKADLNGQIDGLKPARAVQLMLDASVGAQRIELHDLQALAGGARAKVSGLVTHDAGEAPWGVKADATLIDFDPALWWPGRGDSTWRHQADHINALAKIDLQVPAAAPSQAPLALLAAVRGQAVLTLQPSTVAGVPLSGAATLHSTSGTQLTAAVDLVAEGNQFHANGRLATSGNGAADTWDVTVNGPALARLAPVYRVFVPTASADALAGTLQANAHVVGRWPMLTTQGQFDASALRLGALSVQNAEGHWSLASSLSAPAVAQLNITQASLIQASGAPGPSIDSAQLQLSGTGRAHTMELRAESKARPPAWVDSMQAEPPSDAARTLALVQVTGGLIDLPGSPQSASQSAAQSAAHGAPESGPLAGWRGTLTQLDLRRSSIPQGATATPVTTSATAPLLHTANVALELLWAGGPVRATVQPGRADLLGGAVRWNKIAWTGAAKDGGFAQIEADAEVEPLRIAPLLARVQPAFGWGGDLTLVGHLKLRSAPSFSADIVVERAAGDLSVTDEDGTRTLGLTDLRFGLAADNGVWNFTQGMAGQTVGVSAGAVVVRTTPEATWPPADAPIQGVLELRVADLGTWGPWVPPGWRLGGALHASAGINGRFSAPEYTGEVDGTGLSVRNFVQGVNVAEGDVAVKLQGTTARIEHFNAKAGTGSLTLTGDASLGATPKAVLKLVADKFQLLGRVDRRVVLSGTGQLQLEANAIAFDGRFGVDEGLIDFTHSDAPSLASDVEVVRAKTPATATSPDAAASVAGDTAAATAASAPDATATPRAVALDLAVSLGDKLRLRGRGLDTRLGGELHITSPEGKLTVNGTINALDGTYAAYGQKLTIDKGLIMFNGPIDNPRLDIEATRPNLDIRVGVAVSGNANNPRVRLFSEPELADVDKLSWLVMGRASDGLGRTDTALLQTAALALLSGDGESITDKVTKAIGLDDIGVHQETDGDVSQTVVSLGKQLSRRWYVGYERGLNATAGNFQLIYRIAQRFTLRAQSGDDSSLDFIWTWRWR